MLQRINLDKRLKRDAREARVVVERVAKPQGGDGERYSEGMVEIAASRRERAEALKDLVETLHFARLA